MRSLLDTEEEEETKATEITLSTASLLGIFFGLVLICGVFFGFGYSMGRGTGHTTHADSTGNAPTTTDDTPAPQPAAVEPDPQPAPAVVIAPHKEASGEQTEEADATPHPPVPCARRSQYQHRRPPPPVSQWCKSPPSPGARMPMCW